MKTVQLFRQLALAAAVSMSAGVAWAELPEATMYKDPNCGCCSKWADHMREAGFKVKEMPSRDMAGIKAQLGVPEAMSSCHTARVGKYVIEGHVPAADVKRLLAEQPAGARGLSAPGMPMGSPGMEGGIPDRYDVVQFNDDGGEAVFARH
ncbi:DUF411 domain-containing protein [Zoogloeaceae bacterium G21618-S1]|nr:DUF411 domain-containing protein [Zoogloeaceae bacterium G21618-S1]